MVYSEYVDMVDLKDIVSATDLAVNDNTKIPDPVIEGEDSIVNTVTPDIVTPDIVTPDIVTPDIVTPDFASSDFENIYFDFDKYFLRAKSKNILENIYNYLNDHPNATLRLDGHTDWIGTEEYNTTLSQVRTLVAYKYLIEKGIAPDRLDNAWFGESKPAVPNANPDGSDNAANRQLNRRVEIKIDIPDMSALYIQL